MIQISSKTLNDLLFIVTLIAFQFELKVDYSQSLTIQFYVFDFCLRHRASETFAFRCLLITLILPA